MDFPSSWIYTADPNIPLRKNVLLSSNSNKIFIEDYPKIDALAKRRFLLPFFSNAHTHLELSFLKNKMKSGIRFVPWLKQLIELKQNENRKIVLEKMQSELNQSWRNGTGIILDICNDLSIWNEIKPADKRQIIHIYYELLGFNPDVAVEAIANAKNTINSFVSQSKFETRLTPHSFYSCSGSLIKKIKSSAPTPMSVHLAEHQAEIDMFENKNGEMVDYLNSLNRWDKKWLSSEKNIIRYAVENDMLGRDDVAVHLVKANKNELILLAEKGVIPCLCPRSNAFFDNGQPDVLAMLEQKMKPLMGTDSVASNDSLNMLDELRFALKSWSRVKPLEILKMATSNVAQVVSKEEYNEYYPLESGDKKPFIEIIFSHEIEDPFESLKNDLILEQNIYV